MIIRAIIQNIDTSQIDFGGDGTSTNGGNSRVGVADPEGLKIEEGLQKFHPSYVENKQLGTLEKLEVINEVRGLLA